MPKSTPNYSEDHRARVAAEYAELTQRLNKLHAFIASERFQSIDRPERERLLRQSRIMAEYANVLNERIAAFEHH